MADNLSAPNFPLPLDIPGSDKPYVFYSFRDIVNWADENGRVWREALKTMPDVGPATARIVAALAVTPESLSSNTKPLLEGTPTDRQLKEFWIHFEQYSKKGALPATDGLGKRIAELFPSDPQAALGAVLFGTQMHSLPDIGGKIESGRLESLRRASTAVLAEFDEARSSPNRDPFPLTLPLPHGELGLDFSTPAELIEWAQNDSESWKQITQKFPSVGRLTEPVRKKLVASGESLARSAGGIARPGAAAADYARFYEDAGNFIRGRTIAANSALGEYVADRVNTDPYGGLGIALVATDMEQQFAPDALATNNLDVAKTLIAGHRAFAQFAPQKRAQDALDSITTIATTARELAEGTTNELDKLGKSTETIRANVDRLDTEQQSTRPAKHWATKATAHWKRARNFGIAAAASALIFAILDICFGVDFLEKTNISLSRTKIGDNEWTRYSLQLWPLFVFGVALAAQFWAVRSLLRILWNNIRLAEDAEERVYMTRSLLVLARQRSVKEEVTKGILERILQMLFRPAGFMDHREDGPPVNLGQYVEPIADAANTLSGKK